MNIEHALSKVSSSLLAFAVTSHVATAATGEIDPAYLAPPGNVIYSVITPATDGRTLMAESSCIRRFDSGGRLDSTFQAKVFIGNYMATLADGKILVDGMIGWSPSLRKGLIKLNADGSEITSFFISMTDGVRAVGIQQDGRLIVSGRTMTDGMTRNVLRRYESEGAIDASFSPSVNGECREVFVQADGRILIGGEFTTVGGSPRLNLARLLPDGSVDPSFVADCSGGVVSWILETPENKILVGGNFTSVNSTNTAKVVRLQPDGVIDLGFESPAGAIRSIFHDVQLQADGKLVGQGRSDTGPGLYRLDAAGAMDPTLFRADGSSTTRIAFLPDGSILTTGTTYLVQSIVPFTYRIFNDAGVSSLEHGSGGAVEWIRTGALPEVHAATFDVFTSETGWSAPAPATRLDGKWRFNGELPERGAIRARGRTLHSNSSAIIEEKINLGGAIPDISIALDNDVPTPAGTVVKVPNIFAGSSRELKLRIRNHGDGYMQGVTASLSGNDSSELAISFAPPESIGPQEYGTMSIRYSGVALGVRTALLTVNSNDPDTPAYVLTLSATTSSELSPVFPKADEVAHRHNRPFDGSGYTFGTLGLGFAPPPGTVLTVVKSNGPVVAPFSDLPAGAMVTADFDGISYAFRVGYLGGRSGTEVILTLVGEGTLRTAWDPALIGTSASVVRMADGSLLVASQMGAPGAYRLFRLRPDGLVDPLFNAPPIATSSIVAQADGKVLAGNIRLNRDGSLDTSYASGLLENEVLAVQNDGRILVRSTASRSGPYTTLKRLHADGSTDTGFTVDPFNNSISHVEVLPNGDIIICATGVSKVTSSGKAVAGFQTTTLGATAIVQPDWKVIIVVPYQGNDSDRTNLVRLQYNGAADATFSVVTDGYVSTAVLQADGRILISGTFRTVNGSTRYGTARLFADGSLDPSFRCDVDGIVGSMVIREDESMVFGGSMTRVNGIPASGLVKIEAGSASSSLKIAGQTLHWLRGGVSPEFRAVRVEVVKPGETAWTHLGYADRSGEGWQKSLATLPPNATYRMTGEMPTGRSSGQLHSFLSQGSIAPDLRVLSGGGLVAAGSTMDLGSVVSGLGSKLAMVARNDGAGHLHQISASIVGTHAADFSVAVSPFPTIAPLSESGFIIDFVPGSNGPRSAMLEVMSSDPDVPVYRISLSGMGKADLSPGFSSSSDIPFSVGSFDADGRTLGNVRLEFAPAPGTVLTVVNNTGTGPITGVLGDLPQGGYVTTMFGGESYQFIGSYEGGTGNDLVLVLVGPGVIDQAFSAEVDGQVWGVALQPDGKILIGGTFKNVGGVPREGLARLNPDGSLDPGFNARINLRSDSIIIQPDGRVIIAGAFTEVNGQQRAGVARLFPDGSLDAPFIPEVGARVHRILLLRSGKMLIGARTESKGTLIRLHEDGTLDSSFNCRLALSSGVPPHVNALAEEADGSILVGGEFNLVNGITRVGLARVSSTGSLTPFNPNIPGAASCIVIQPDGKFVIGGGFVAVGNTSRRRLARFNPNGSLDMSFAPSANALVSSLALQTDGKIVISGAFTTINTLSRNRIARILPTGAVDATFIGEADGMARTAFLDDQGQVLMGGDFGNVSQIRSGSMVRLRNDIATSTLGVEDDSILRWERSGSAPDMKSVEFVASADGRIWTRLGEGARSTGGWELAGATMPAAGFVRAQGEAITSNRTTALLEKTLLLGRPMTAIEAWRAIAFGSATNERSGADSADPDGDGYVNLIEYAFGLDPLRGGAGGIPQWITHADGHEISFNLPNNFADITYGGEWSETMAEGDWHPAEDLSDGTLKKFRVEPSPLPKVFLRLKVSNP